jgi:c(7)-type cytochrome triheme protein
MKKWFIVLLIALAFFQTMAAREVCGNETVNGGGILYTEPVKAVLFTHGSHGEKRGLVCDRCHSGLFEMEALKVQEKKDFNMDSLYRGKYCGACHNGKQAFSSDTQCARCHVRVKGLEPGQKMLQRDIPIYKVSEAFGKGERTVRFEHQIHTRVAQCSRCHPGLFKVKQGTNKVAFTDHGEQRYCFVCHDGQKAFSWNDCSRCHAKLPAPKQTLVFGQGGKGVSFRHQTHLGKLKCGSCHLQLFPFAKGATKVTFQNHAEGRACFACHKEKTGASFYSDCSRCHTDRKAAAAPQGPGPLYYTIKGAGPVQFLHGRHGSYSCDTCHPTLFAMQKGATKITMTEMYQGKSCGLCHDGEKAFQVMQCAKCHQNN